MRNAPLDGDTALHVRSAGGGEHLTLIEVEGKLEGDASRRWGALLGGILGEKPVDGIVVDLRGCRGVDSHCLESLQAADVTVRTHGGSGVALVVFSGSAVARRLQEAAADGLLVQPTASAAVLALDERVADPLLP